ncbi:MAG: ergothioneine biosynthesis protein EgtB [Bythopirellula sp.]
MSQQVESQPGATRADLLARYNATRAFTSKLCETLSPEDCCLQSMTSASPVRWHLAHTSWFFETFLLKHDPRYEVFDEHYEVLFNSYYNAVGEQFPRDQRGLLSRPTLKETIAYREHVDLSVANFLESGSQFKDLDVDRIVELGVQHEQQHQELILTDVKHLFSLNPLLPTYRDGKPAAVSAPIAAAEWLARDEGLYEIGSAQAGFHFDNEAPRHRVFLEDHALSSRPVTSGEFLEFIADDGYARPELWLSLGWEQIQSNGWSHPLYWYERAGQWQEFTLAGLRPLDPSAPVCHVSYFEADAFARWAGARLPTEAEWEGATAGLTTVGHFADTLLADDLTLHPSATRPTSGEPGQMFGDVWEWTASPYTPYPGYQAVPGALGEYNGKFMCNQYVLRGGSVATSSDHIRPTYRNFFPPSERWQFSGFRLAK